MQISACTVTLDLSLYMQNSSKESENSSFLLSHLLMKIYGWRCQIIDDLHNATGSRCHQWKESERVSEGGRAIKSFVILQQA